MKKIILVSLMIVLSSCAQQTPKPIEKYKGSVVIHKFICNICEVGRVEFKTKDSIYEVYIHRFDMQNITEGDTIK